MARKGQSFAPPDGTFHHFVTLIRGFAGIVVSLWVPFFGPQVLCDSFSSWTWVLWNLPTSSTQSLYFQQ